jgi:WD40 repeat protein
LPEKDSSPPEFRLPCPHCGARLLIALEEVPKVALCPECDTAFPTPAEFRTPPPVGPQARKQHQQARWLAVATVSLVLLGAAAAVFIVLRLNGGEDRQQAEGDRPATRGTDRGRESKDRKPDWDVEQLLDVPPDPPPDPAEATRRAAVRQKYLEEHQVRERELLRVLRREPLAAGSDNRPVLTLRAPNLHVSHVLFGPDGKTLAAADHLDGELWNLRARKVRRTRIPQNSRIRRLALSPDGRVLASAPESNVIQLWDARTGEPTHACRGLVSMVEAVTFSPDGTLVLGSARISGNCGEVRAWNVSSGRPSGHPLVIPLSPFSECLLAYSPCGRILACSMGERVVLCDGMTRRPRRVLDCGAHVWDFAFSPDGNTLAITDYPAEDQYRLRLWQVRTGKPLRTFETGKARVTRLAFSPDGKLLVSYDPDGEEPLRLWDPATGKEVRVPGWNPEGGSPQGLAFSPGGTLLATAEGSAIRVWRVSSLIDDRIPAAVEAVRKFARVTRGEGFDIVATERARDEDLAKLWALPRVTGLDLRGMKNTLTDAGLVHVAGLECLEDLDLGGCAKITNAAAVSRLSGLAMLQRLNLKGTALSKNAINRLKRSLPNTVISED